MTDCSETSMRANFGHSETCAQLPRFPARTYSNGPIREIEWCRRQTSPTSEGPQVTRVRCRDGLLFLRSGAVTRWATSQIKHALDPVVRQKPRDRDGAGAFLPRVFRLPVRSPWPCRRLRDRRRRRAVRHRRCGWRGPTRNRRLPGSDASRSPRSAGPAQFSAVCGSRSRSYWRSPRSRGAETASCALMPKSMTLSMTWRLPIVM